MSEPLTVYRRQSMDLVVLTTSICDKFGSNFNEKQHDLICRRTHSLPTETIVLVHGIPVDLDHSMYNARSLLLPSVAEPRC